MALQLRPCPFCLPSSRSYATATIVKTKPPKQRSSHKSARNLPAYPYGPARWYKQRDSGLYGGATILHGNSRTEKTAKKNDAVSPRTFKPNIQLKKIWSASLNTMVSVKVRMRTLKTIDKVGGLDNYLIGNKPARIKELGLTGWRLKWKVLRTNAMQKRIASEREALGLPREGFYAAEKAEQEYFRKRALEVAEKYIKAIEAGDEMDVVRSQAQAETEATDGLLDEYQQSDRLDTGRVQDASLEELDDKISQDLSLAEPELETLEPELPAESLDSKLNRLAITIAKETRRASPTLSLPDLKDSVVSHISLLPSLQPVELEQTLIQPEQYLLHQLEQYAVELKTSTEALTEAARTQIAEREAKLAKAEAKKAVKLKRREEVAAAHRSGLPTPRSDYHPEIDTALQAGASTLLPLYRFHLKAAQENLGLLLKQRNEKRHKLANVFLRELKTRNSKGGKGTYVKRTAWDQCKRKAVSKMSRRPDILDQRVTPNDLTNRQWRRLFLAGRMAAREERDEMKLMRRRELEASPETRRAEGVRAWMSERELGAMERIGAAVRAWQKRARARIFG